MFIAANARDRGIRALDVLPFGQRVARALGQRLATRGLRPDGAMQAWVTEHPCDDLDPETTERMRRKTLQVESRTPFFSRVSRSILEDRPRSDVLREDDRALLAERRIEIAPSIGARAVSLAGGHMPTLARPVDLARYLREATAV